MRINKLRASGFTIVELLIVIVIIGILAAITIVAYNGIQQRAIGAALSSDLTAIARQFKVSQVTNDAYPTTVSTTRPGVTYTVTTNNASTPQSFCIMATQGSVNYFVTDSISPTSGVCTGSGLIAYLDAGNPASYPGSGTTWTDLSGNGNNGTLTNGVGYSAANGGALTFDGVDDYVSSVNSQNYQDIVIIFQPDFSLNNGSNLAGIIASGTGSDMSMRFSGANGVGPWTIPNPGNTNDWANSPASYYVNGTASNQVASGWNILSGNRTNMSPFPANFAYYLGTSGYANRYFKGKIAAVFLFNRVLTNAERVQYFANYRSRFGL